MKHRSYLLVLPLLLTLAGCGGGALTSFDAEKARIREAFSGSKFACTEGNAGAVHWARCDGPDNGFASLSEDRPGVLQVKAAGSFSDYDGAKAVEALMTSYGATDADVQSCRGDANDVVRRFSNYTLTCQRTAGFGANGQGIGLQLFVIPQKSF